MEHVALPGESPRAARPVIRDLNAHLVCVLCGGYFVDATTIVECLHSFCRSCIVRHLETSKFCPICDVQVHKAKPLHSIRSDPTLQTLVYKLVPGLYQVEMQRRRTFHSGPQPVVDHDTRKPTAEERGEGLAVFFSPEDSVSLSLEYYDSASSDEEDSSESEPQVVGDEGVRLRRFLQCPAAVSVRHLKRFVRLKFGLSSEHRVDIIYAGECLPDDFTLMDVAYTFAWKQTAPMNFSYRIFHLLPDDPADLNAMSPSEEAPLPSPADTPPDAAEAPTDSATALVPAPAPEATGSPSTPTTQSDPGEEPPAKRACLGDLPVGSPHCCAAEPEPDSEAKEAEPETEKTEPDPEPGPGDEKPADVEGDWKETDTKLQQDSPDSLMEDASTNESSGLEIQESSSPHETEDASPGTTPSPESKGKRTESPGKGSAGDDFNEYDDDDFTLRISSTDEADFDFEEENDANNSSETNKEGEEEGEVEMGEVEGEEDDDGQGEDEPKEESLSVPNEVVEPTKEEKCEIVPHKRIKLEITKEKTKQKDEKEYPSGRKRNKHKSKHHRGEDGTKKRKTHKSEIVSTPTILQYDEDSIKLKVKLSGPSSNTVVTNCSSSVTSNHHRHHHHHHSKHHHNKHQKQNESVAEASLSTHASRSNGDSTASAKERLLQMRAVRHKNIAFPNKNFEITQSDESVVNKSTKSGPIILPPSSITVSKVNSSEKRRQDQKLINNCNNENKRPSLEIMLVNPPSTTQVNNNSTKSTPNKLVTSVNIKQNPSSTNNIDSTKKTATPSDTKQIRPPPPTIPLVRIKKPQTATIRPPTGLTITPKLPAPVPNKTPPVQKASKSVDNSASLGTQQKKEDKVIAEAESVGEENAMRHDDIGALDLSGKSSRFKDGSPSSGSRDSPDVCAPSTVSPSPTKPTAHQSILSIAHSLVHRQLSSLQGNPSSSPTNRNGTSSPTSTDNTFSSVLLGGLSAAGAISGAGTGTASGIAPAAMSNLKTLSDAAVHIRNLMAAQGKTNGRGVAKQLANLQNAQQQPKSPSSQVNNPAGLGMSGRTTTGPFSATSRTPSFNPLHLPHPHHHHHHPSPSIAHSPNHNQQYTISGSPVPPSPGSPIRIPIPPSSLKTSPAGRGSGPPGTPRSNVPRLHELFPSGGNNSGVAGRGKGIGGVSYPNRTVVNNMVTKPGPNQGVRHIPNPSAALLFRQQTQHRLSAQQSQLNQSARALNTLNSLTATSKAAAALFQNQAFNNSPKSNPPGLNPTSVSSSSTLPAVSSIRKMENMTRNIEKVAAGLTVRAVEANVSK